MPDADGKFYEWSGDAYTYAQNRVQDWQLPDGAMSGELNDAYERFREKYPVAADVETRTKAAVVAKNEARDLFKRLFRQFIRSYVTNNPAVSDEDRTNMGLPIHKTTHTPAPEPDKAPEFRIDTSVIRRLTIHFQAEGSKTKAKPAGVHGAEAKWAVLAAPPTTVDELIHSSFDTNSPLTLEYGEPERGKTVYICLRWENTRGVKGPWSDIVMAIVP